MSEQLSNNLILEIKRAIVSRDFVRLSELKDICDRLHDGIESYKGFTTLPSDILYEELVRTLNDITHPESVDYNYVSQLISSELSSISRETEVVTKRGLVHATRKNAKGEEIHGGIWLDHNDKLPDLWMGSIPKTMVITHINQAYLFPKFDGCSCGIKFVKSYSGWEVEKAITKGNDEKYHERGSDITDRFISISANVISSLNSSQVQSYKFSNQLTFESVTTFNMRGEIVMKNKDDTEKACAPWVAGKLNPKSNIDIWNNFKDKIEFIPYEFMKLTFNNHIEYVPTQTEVNEFLEIANLNDYEIMLTDQLSESYSDDYTFDFIKNHFKHLQSSTTRPLDGIVYCTTDWTYPQTKSAKTDTNYGKYAWKECSEVTSILTEIEYNIGIKGDITLLAKYQPVKICKSIYKQCKVFPTEMLKLLTNYGIGINSLITIGLQNNTIPQIKMAEPDPEIIPYEWITNCPWCNAALTRTVNKDKCKLTCTNKACPEIIIKKMCNFLDVIQIKGIAEGKLHRLSVAVNLLNVHRTLMKDDSIIDNISKLTLRRFMIAISFGSDLAITKYTNGRIVDTLPLLKSFEFLDTLALKMDDPFAYDIIDFVYNMEQYRKNIKSQ